MKLGEPRDIKPYVERIRSQVAFLKAYMDSLPHVLHKIQIDTVGNDTAADPDHPGKPHGLRDSADHVR
ncbi:MAG: hypothetical protein GF350_16985 [Chitinivibrionales bacterium]|nr:hypothetical protein [Chitinivibrionales bacterium]